MRTELTHPEVWKGAKVGMGIRIGGAQPLENQIELFIGGAAREHWLMEEHFEENASNTPHVNMGGIIGGTLKEES